MADFHLLLYRRQCRVRRRQLRRCFLQPGADVIQFLLCDQVGPLLGHCRKPVIRQLPDSKRRFGPGHLAPRPDDLQLAPLLHRRGLRQLLLQLRHFQGADHLSFPEQVTNVHRHRLDVAGDFCVDVDLLPRAELGGHLQLPRQILPDYRSDADRLRLGRGRLRRSAIPRGASGAD